MDEAQAPADATNPITVLLRRIEQEVAAHLEPVGRAGYGIVAFQVQRAITASVGMLVLNMPHEAAQTILDRIAAAEAILAERQAAVNAAHPDPNTPPLAQAEPEAGAGAPSASALASEQSSGGDATVGTSGGASAPSEDASRTTFGQP